jgi:[ribosomal protein S18]-alanine N-acetyltransferase
MAPKADPWFRAAVRLAVNISVASVDRDMWPRQRKPKPLADPMVLAASTQPSVLEMGHGDLNECWRLDQQCFSDGEAYDRETIRYLLSHNQSVCYKVVADGGEMVAFVVGMVEPDGTGHVVALGVSPRHRRVGHARRLMAAVETGFLGRGISTIRLEVRTTNNAAQQLYLNLGFTIVRRMPRYYTSGDDGYLMVKSLP